MNLLNAELHFDCFGFIAANTPLFAHMQADVTSWFVQLFNRANSIG